MSRSLPRRRLSEYGAERIAFWVIQTAKRWHGIVRVYLHPCGDVILVANADPSPMSDRLLVGAYNGAADEADIAADIEAASLEDTA